MQIITISRQFGSGGRELGKRLADLLGYDYYDREIVTSISQNKGVDEDYVERMLDNRGWKSIPITLRHSFRVPTITNDPQISLLLEQKKIIERIADKSRDCVIVGRNADFILKEHRPFRIFVCADTNAKLKRCMDRAEADENLSPKQIIQNMKQIDKARAKTRMIMCESKWGEPTAYDMTINTTDWEIKTLAQAVADFALCRFGGNRENSII